MRPQKKKKINPKEHKIAKRVKQAPAQQEIGAARAAIVETGWVRTHICCGIISFPFGGKEAPVLN